MAATDATKTGEKHRVRGLRGGDKQSWMGVGGNNKSSSTLIYLACFHHYPVSETAN